MKKNIMIKILPLLLLPMLLAGCESEYGRKISDMKKADPGVSSEKPVEEIETYTPGKAIEPYVSGGAKYYFRAEDQYLSVYNGSEFEEIYVKGVNLGLGKPGHFPGETAITKEEYARWLEQISEMNANCIRVYTVQPPAFYEAFYEYNENADEPLYLFHGTWYDETRLTETADAFDEELQNYLYKDMEDIVDLIHGNCRIAEHPGKASGLYQYDISPYVIGWILGIESDADFVTVTDENNPQITSYEGTYLCAENLEPFEVFWAQTGDYILSYEMDKYGMQRPLSYSNWPTADILEHPSETMAEEYSVDLNVENLEPTEAFQCGLFASYHIYPYYPNFLYTELEYSNYRDEDGNINTYKAYLEDMIQIHDMPVLVAEFGIPVSRGVTHANIYTGFNQGNKTEKEQGEMLASMMEDIYDTGYAGGLVFTWQDEWFKRTWNTEEYTDPNRRAYWYDVMTCEQHFGLLDFIPEGSVILDGRADEWSADDIFLETEDTVLSVKYDCAYLYLMIQKENADYDEEKIWIPFDITPNSGSMVYEGLRFDKPVDFVMVLDGQENSQLLVQSYYDRYQYEYDKYDKEIQTTSEMKQPDNTLFQPIYFLMERELVLQDRIEVIPLQKFAAGKLVFGTNDFDTEEYNSLADFYYEGDILEVRIPWLMLNFRDPSSKEIEDDFWKHRYFSGINIEEISIGLSTEEAGSVKMEEYQWENWDYYPYSERLRKGYYVLQEQFAALP
ncbi:MAG: family 2 glycosyl transferase [Ruminococcus sp.]|nr:family 2 glycosyl transferase [Ruminococcus sp.]